MHNLWDKIWKDKEGHVVIWQMPNLPLLAWIVLTLASLLLHGKAADILSIAATISLAVWAVLEVVRGVNYFRRGLGLIVLLYVVAGIFNIGR